MFAIVAVAGMLVAPVSWAGGRKVSPTKTEPPKAESPKAESPKKLFAPLKLAEARKTAQEAGKLLVVYFSATWCEPCRQMHENTWTDPKVIEWIGQNAIALDLDLDKDVEEAKALEPQGVPAVIAFKGDKELDRTYGYVEAPRLLDWLNGLSRGKVFIDSLRARIASQPKDMEARYKLARTLLDARRYEEATTEFVWLWQHILEYDQSFTGVRGSYMVLEIQRLVEAYPPARTAFSALRDAAAPGDATEIDERAMSDWMDLNKALGETQRSLTWFESWRKSGARDRRIERDFIDLLIEQDRWADVGRLYEHPAADLRQEHERNEEMVRYWQESLRVKAGQMCRGLRAAGRVAEAEEVEAEARKIDPSTEMEAALKGELKRKKRK